VHIHTFSLVLSCDLRPRRSVIASHNVFLPHQIPPNLELLHINQELINTYLNFIMSVNLCINQEMIITKNIITRLNWPSNHEDFKPLDNGQSDRHRGASRTANPCLLGGLTTIGGRSDHQLLFTWWSNHHKGQSDG
jgi:hypothetical protein